MSDTVSKRTIISNKLSVRKLTLDTTYNFTKEDTLDRTCFIYSDLTIQTQNNQGVCFIYKKKGYLTKDY